MNSNPYVYVLLLTPDTAPNELITSNRISDISLTDSTNSNY
jgi:hypothetical protein